ncbi:hypothetical protein QSV37_14815 [Acinetobacter sp. VNK23]|uniref:hypothetical protein n=1 Tax=Acinetobacter thutiue TaxID=2998078 RepID=UPI00257766C6|nr:hypothetical protein [Acinetobacter thutiue]MDM1021565.1 hypothetical protein [Acinetobacter thutiue]
MSTKGIKIENQEFPSDDFNQDNFIDESQVSTFDEFSQDIPQDDDSQIVIDEYSQDAGYDDFLQPEAIEIQKQPRKKR